jgi:hypothetical protein
MIGLCRGFRTLLAGRRAEALERHHAQLVDEGKPSEIAGVVPCCPQNERDLFSKPISRPHKTESVQVRGS